MSEPDAPDSSNTIETLRKVLFDTLRDLKNPASTLTLERAKAINDTAQTIINSAKVELAFMEQTGATKSAFVPQVEHTADGAAADVRGRLTGPRRYP